MAPYRANTFGYSCVWQLCQIFPTPSTAAADMRGESN